MSTVFISYRRQTAAGEARALFNDFVARLGKGSVFMDVDSISLGRDFRSVLQKTLASCDLMLVMIDKDWATAKDERGRIRLENTGDYVRMEIETALKRDIAVTPVLIQGAHMPAADELPAEVRDLAYRNGFDLSHNRWESDLGELIRRLGLDVPEHGGQVATDLPIARGEGGAKDREVASQATVDHRQRYEYRPLAFGHELAAGPADSVTPTAPPSPWQQSRKQLVIGGVLGIICLGGVAGWLTTPSVDRPQGAPARTLPAPDQGNAFAQYNLGINYRDGLGGLPKDDREAARLFKLAADQGNAMAQVALGVAYMNGLGGLPKDDREAARLLELAADQGNAMAQVALKRLQNKR
jgi:hypothetical protein